MKNRLVRKINEAHGKKRKLFCAYLTLGFPSISYTEKLIVALVKVGADIIELGFPFSDPLADGPTIQFSSEYALRHGVKFDRAFQLVSRLRKRGVQVPILFFSYYNPIYQKGYKRFTQALKKSGFDGVIIPDLPPEEDRELPRLLRSKGLSLVYLVTPTSTSKRIKMITQKSSGFIYLVSLKGVTGVRKKLDANVVFHVCRIRKATRKAVLIGFGVSNPKQAHRMSRISDGVIVGSAFIEAIRRARGRLGPVVNFAKRMVSATKGSK